MDEKDKRSLAAQLANGILAGRGRETTPEEAVAIYWRTLEAIEELYPQEDEEMEVSF